MPTGLRSCLSRSGTDVEMLNSPDTSTAAVFSAPASAPGSPIASTSIATAESAEKVRVWASTFVDTSCRPAMMENAFSMLKINSQVVKGLDSLGVAGWNVSGTLC